MERRDLERQVIRQMLGFGPEANAILEQVENGNLRVAFNLERDNDGSLRITGIRFIPQGRGQTREPNDRVSSPKRRVNNSSKPKKRVVRTKSPKRSKK